MSSGNLLKLGKFHAYLKIDVLLPQDFFSALHYTYLLVEISFTFLVLLLVIALGFSSILFTVFI